MRNERNFILQELKQNLTLKDRILLHFFKNYTYKIYKNGVKEGFSCKKSVMITRKCTKHKDFF